MNGVPRNTHIHTHTRTHTHTHSLSPSLSLMYSECYICSAVGCPQLVVSPYASFHQATPGYATVGSTAVVRCNSTNLSWTLTCGTNNTWMTTTTTSGQHHHQLFDDCPSMTTVLASAGGTARGTNTTCHVYICVYFVHEVCH